MRKIKSAFELLILLITCTMVVSCINSEKKEISYRAIDEGRIEMFNNELETSEVTTLEELASLYRAKDIYAEGNYSYETVIKELHKDLFELSIKEEGLMDDSIFGIISIIEVERNNNGSWKVLKIKEAYKCWPNRGHQEWGPEFCN